MIFRVIQATVHQKTQQQNHKNVKLVVDKFFTKRGRIFGLACGMTFTTFEWDRNMNQSYELNSHQ
jgi:hypothetical protein